MITDNIKQFDVQTNITGDKIGLTFDEDSLSHIMSVLIDLYSDPIYAVIREYSTNAYDAHIAAGISLPIEVTTPGQFSNNITIRDYGIGLSLQDIHDIYSKYGASTKRQTNDMVGMLGLGCKSALTYTNQFTLTSVKDGKRVQTVISRDENGSGSITIVDQSDTLDANGTEIVIPTRIGDAAKFMETAENFFSFWPEDTVLLNGMQPKRFSGVAVTDNIFITDNDYSSMFRNHDIIVMGNVPYPHPNGRELANLSYDYRTVAFVDIGDVNFSPSRESLQMTSKTKDCLEHIKLEFQLKLPAAIQDSIANASSFSEAIHMRNDWHKYLGYGMSMPNVLYKGYTVPTRFEVKGFKVNVRSYRSYRDSFTALTSDLRGTLVVSDYGVKYNSSHRNKAIKYFEHQFPNEKLEQIVFVTERMPVSPFIDKTHVVSYNELRKMKIDAKNSTGPRKQMLGSYNCITVTGGIIDYHTEIMAADLDTTKPLMYIEESFIEGKFMRYFAKKYPDMTIVKLSKNRTEKFLRLFPGTKGAFLALRELLADDISKLDKDEIASYCLMHHNRNMYNFVKLLNNNELLDPEFNRMVRIAKIDTTNVSNFFSGHRDILSGNQHAIFTTNPFAGFREKYPLVSLPHERGDFFDHCVWYLNAVYSKDVK